MIEVKVPELAESITEGTISQWLIKVGDKVEKGDNLVELETDKVNIEISAENDGVIEELLKEPGDNVEVGEIIAYLGNGEGSSSEIFTIKTLLKRRSKEEAKRRLLKKQNQNEESKAHAEQNLQKMKNRKWTHGCFTFCKKACS